MRIVKINDPRSIFMSAYKVWSVNPMSPNIIKYDWSKDLDYVYELSSGKFLSKKVFGVTVVEVETEGDVYMAKPRTDLSQAFSSEKEALNYIKML